MMNKLVFALCLVIGLSSCEYKFIEPDVIDTTDTISFSQQIIPIFEDNNCDACHPSQDQPDLTSANAYQSIQTNQLIDLADPVSSIIYTYPSPVTAGHNWNKYSDQEASLILLWIQQGALDN